MLVLTETFFLAWQRCLRNDMSNPDEYRHDEWLAKYPAQIPQSFSISDHLFTSVCLCMDTVIPDIVAWFERCNRICVVRQHCSSIDSFFVGEGLLPLHRVARRLLQCSGRHIHTKTHLCTRFCVIRPKMSGRKVFKFDKFLASACSHIVISSANIQVRRSVIPVIFQRIAKVLSGAWCKGRYTVEYYEQCNEQILAYSLSLFDCSTKRREACALKGRSKRGIGGRVRDIWTRVLVQWSWMLGIYDYADAIEQTYYEQ